MDEKTLALGLGDAIRARRTKAGYSQEAFADRAGIERSMMGRVERGEMPPQIKTLLRVCKALDIPLSRLIRHGEREASKRLN